MANIATALIANIFFIHITSYYFQNHLFILPPF